MVHWNKPIGVVRRALLGSASKTLPARVICTDCKGPFPYVVLVNYGSVESLRCFGKDGKHAYMDEQVVNVPETRTVWRAFLFDHESGGVCMLGGQDKEALERNVQSLKSLDFSIIEDIHEYTFEVPTCAD